MPRRVQYTYNTVILNVREKGGGTKEKLTTKPAGRAGSTRATWRRSCPGILVLLHVLFQDVLGVISVITIITLEPLVLKALFINSILRS